MSKLRKSEEELKNKQNIVSNKQQTNELFLNFCPSDDDEISEVTLLLLITLKLKLVALE